MPVTVLSGNAVSVLGHGATTANNFSGVAVAPSQSSTQSSKQVNHASAKNTSHGSSKDGYGKGSHGKHSKDSTPQRACASSHNYSSQQATQRQKTVPVAVPVTVASGNAISILGGGKTTSHNNSGVAVIPSQSSSQHSSQLSSISAVNSGR